MDTKVIDDFSFCFRKESVIVTYNRQQISVNNYYLPNKRPLRRFFSVLETSDRMDLDTLYRLAREHELNIMGLSSAFDNTGKTKVMW
jgi:hypothetical protein